MATAFGFGGTSGQQKGILERCDQHSHKLMSYCNDKKTVLCRDCFQEHTYCNPAHKDIKDVTSDEMPNTIASDLKQLKDNECRFEKDIAEEKRKCLAIIHSSTRKFDDDIRKQAVHHKHAIDRTHEKFITIKNNTNAIENHTKNHKTKNLDQKSLVIASTKLKQYIKTHTEIASEILAIQEGICCLIDQGPQQIKHIKNAYDSKIGGSGHSMSHQETKLQMQEQVQEKTKRREEASKAMLYGVYSNVIMMLETFEARNDGEQITKSKIDVPDQSWKTFEDVEANLESQLVVFEAQLNACPTGISVSLKKELRIQTIYWAATRAEENMSISATDKFVAKLYEILVKGKTHHRIFDESRKKASKSIMRKTLPLIFGGKNKASELDSSYESDPSKKAPRPETRTPSNDSKIRSGADRITEVNRSLWQFLDEDVLQETANLQ